MSVKKKKKIHDGRYWVPWYSGVVGNEKVDTSAKNAPISDEIN